MCRDCFLGPYKDSYYMHASCSLQSKLRTYQVIRINRIALNPLWMKKRRVVHPSLCYNFTKEKSSHFPNILSCSLRPQIGRNGNPTRKFRYLRVPCPTGAGEDLRFHPQARQVRYPRSHRPDTGILIRPLVSTGILVKHAIAQYFQPNPSHLTLPLQSSLNRSAHLSAQPHAQA